MSKFRKRPVVVEAVQYLGQFKEMMREGVEAPAAYFNDYPSWLDEAWDGGSGALSLVGQTAARPADWKCYVEIKTLEGVMRANPGDWIIKGVKGEIYACKPDIFALTYEPAEEAP